MSVQLVNDARRIAFYMEDDLHGIKQLAQAIFLIAEQIEYERCESILRIAHIMMDLASTLSRGRPFCFPPQIFVSLSHPPPSHRQRNGPILRRSPEPVSNRLPMYVPRDFCS